MQKVVCRNCENLVDPVDCWCLITVGNKERKYECKKFCIIKAPVKPAPVSKPLEVEKADESIRAESPVVSDWSPAYPSESIVQKIVNWFTVPSGYTKVKLQ